MFQRILQLFYRYASHHARLQRPGFALRDPSGQPAGFVDRISLADGVLLLEGWTTAPSVRLRLGAHEVRVEPDLKRPDAAEALGMSPDTPVGFTLSVPWQDDVAQLDLLYPAAEPVPHEVLRFSGRQHDAARRRLIGPFVRDAGRAVPHVWRWYRHRDPAARQAIKHSLRLGAPTQTRVLDAAVLEPGTPVACDDTPICIIIPIYNAFDLLEELLTRVRDHTDVPYHLVLIEDCSPDERVRPFVQNWVDALPAGQATLLLNAQNKGFVGSVNAGLDVARDRGEDVVLLNSDALVPKGWASRLMAPIRSDEDVATVTPMSNDAEIFTAPRICERVDIDTGAVDLIDARAATLSAASPLVEAPTGVGFCMAMARRYLDMVPHLDTAFGRGYGEEVDWCQKIRARGGRHVAQPRLFVEHRGGMSFGSDAKLQMILENNALITRRYPAYDREVQTFIRDDPLATVRLALGVAALAAQATGPVPIYVAHSMGGGAELYLQHRLTSDVASAGGAVVLRVGGVLRWQVELVTAQGVQSLSTDAFEHLSSVLDPVTRRHVIYSCGVGHPDPITLPGHLLDLTGAHDRLTLLLHDFFPLSPSFNLLNGDGVFTGVPSDDDTDPAHQLVGPRGEARTLADWRQAWRAAMERADEVRVFSNSGRDLAQTAYPEAQAALRVVPHELPHVVPRLPKPDPDAPLVLGVLGNIGFVKGAGVLVDLDRELARRGSGKLVVLGQVDPDYPLSGGSVIHGAYNIADLPALVERYGITAWLVPSICPETFSYTTHESLATGLPVWCFDLGAQGEAVRQAVQDGAPGGVLPLPQSGATAGTILDRISSRA
ncbi:glycosyltransferase [Thalassorhabdomicrobium marinisediminis]|uniref:glycosyltransferase n=1 Tax=Thalassorhabdomicrobium marinisediminis TaxID=2170577 RepID=UPI002492554D|nr:glycosyltransferase [Thalassorhabdomicrobium marinisediminis]